MRLRAKDGRRLLVGVIHLAALPGAPRFGGSMHTILRAACDDARAWQAGGADALVVENFGDVPFHRDALPPETVAAMALALAAVRDVASGLEVGVNALRNDARAALGLCAATGASFLRVNVHTGAAVTDQGIVEGRAAETLRERQRLAPRAAILADVHVKHARPLGGGSLVQAAADAVRRGLADGLILTGDATGAAADPADLEAVREQLPDVALFVGSGVTPDGAARRLAVADGAIVGTWAKRDGRVEAPVDTKRVALLRRAFDAVPATEPPVS